MGEQMSFQGKHVDDAIAAACNHFKCTREELEVEIVSGGSSGIFGLVGVKKAKIKACLRELTPVKPAAAPRVQEKAKSAPKPAPKTNPRSKPVGKNGTTPAGKKGTKPVGKNGSKPAPKPRNARPANKPSHKPASTPPALDQPRALAVKDTQPKKAIPRKAEDVPRPVPDFSVEEAQAHIIKSMNVLLTNISDDCVLTVDMQSSPIEVIIEDDANSGLIIGRDGQTISALQYILNRIISRKFPGIARIQLDAGDYREKQDEQLRKTALFLSQKAKTSHRTQSTRPLSSYHRRVVHMALQEDEDIQTRSKGDGPMKRVLVMPRRKKDAAGANANAPRTHRSKNPNAVAEQDETHEVS